MSARPSPSFLRPSPLDAIATTAARVLADAAALDAAGARIAADFDALAAAEQRRRTNPEHTDR